MSNVTLSIGGRDYTVACDSGEEAHVAALGRLIADKLSAMPGNVALGESRSLLFAALLLADEVNDLRQNPPAPRLAPPPPTPAAAIPEELSQGLEAIAERIENIATHLEHGPPSA